MSGKSIRVWIGAAVSLAAALMSGCGSGDESAPESNEPANAPTPAAGRAPRAGDVLVNSIGMKLAYVPPGKFMMGSPADEPGRHKDETRHPVTITNGFYIGVTEVTQAQYRAVMGFNPSETKGDDLPVSKVSWHNATAFCKKLSRAGGRTYRLPTEAEWEYACRAGAAGPFAGSGRIDEMGWHMDNSDERPHPVARKSPNAWGLVDMHGNAMEWCADWCRRDLGAAPATDPASPAAGKQRVARGGSWGHFARACRSAARASYNPAYQLRHLGLRVVMETDSSRPGTSAK